MSTGHELNRIAKDREKKRSVKRAFRISRAKLTKKQRPRPGAST